MTDTTRLRTICNVLHAEITRHDGLTVPDSALLRVGFLHLLHVERLARAAVILAEAGAGGTAILQARALFEAVVNILYLWTSDGKSDELAAWWDAHDVDYHKILTALQRLAAARMNTNSAPSTELLQGAEQARTDFKNTYQRDAWSIAGNLELRALDVQRSGLLARIEAGNVNVAEDYALFYRVASSYVHVSSMSATGVLRADDEALTVQDDDESLAVLALAYAANHAVVMIRAWLALNGREPSEVGQLLEQAWRVTSPNP